MKRLTNDQIDAAYEYMHRQWTEQDEGWHDYSAADASGDVELFAHILCEYGAIDSANSFEPELEKTVERLAKDFRKLSRKAQDKRYADAFKDCLIAVCQDCNHVSFVYDGNEQLYPELETQCWECRSKNIELKRGLK